VNGTTAPVGYINENGGALLVVQDNRPFFLRGDLWFGGIVLGADIGD
jgi:hypothetical protein